MPVAPRRRLAHTAALALLLASACADPTLAPDGALRPRSRPSGDHTPAPTTVTVAASFQSEAGCAGDWQPTCSATQLIYDANDGVWQRALGIPAGSYEYKAALNGTWDENYGVNATANGANLSLSLAAPATVKFYYDHATHWITDNRRSVIVTAAGSFQSELGCSGDWDPTCLRSWLQDPDGDGIYTFVTSALPAGSYEVKAAINEGWDENYGASGQQNGANIPFTVAAGATMRFAYDAATHVLTITEVQPPVTTVTAVGSFQSEAGCAGDWDPTCAATHLTYDATSGTWRAVFTLPGGSYEAKTAINDSWNVSYGAGGVLFGDNIPFTVPPTGAAMRFTYDPSTHVLTIAEAVPTSTTAAQQLAVLRAMVGALALDRGTTTSLQAKLADAQSAIASGATAAACSSLADFMAQVRALSGRKIPVDGATALLDAATQIRATLGC
ncbi:hypothetical protein [Roseisolibacter agri]|nr:hypothetical protein [Roseisolibacter agri]